MNKKFTKLIAAVALLTLLIPMKGWGQTRDNWSYTFSAKVWSAAGAQTINEVSWTMAGTGGSYFGYDGTKGQQFGSSSAPYSAVSLSTTGISGTITEVAVNTSGASSINATVAVSVDGTAFTCSGNTTASLTSTATTYTFTGSDNGEIVISWAQTSSKAIYVKSISVTYSVGQTYTVTYDANEGTGAVPTDGSTYPNGATVTVKNRNTLEHATLGFMGWNTAADGSGTFYDPGDTFTMGSSDVTLYAVWTAKCTFAYNGNGNTGGAVPTGYYTSYGTGAKVTVVDNTGSLVKTGAAWEAWNTAADGSGTTYNPDDVFTITANTTLYAKWRSLATYTLVTNVSQIESGKHYVIASSGAENGPAKAMSTQASNNRTTVDVTLADHTITETSGVFEFVINGPDADGFYTIYDVTNNGFLYAASSSSNYLRNQAANDDNGRWSISINTTTGEGTIVAQGSNTNKYMRFNPNIFSCYGSGSSVTALPYLYKKAETSYTFVKNIRGYGSSTGGYYLVASPIVGNITPSAANGFLTSAYDLYKFDQNEPNGKWCNYETPVTGGWDIELGKGYLYASQAATTLIFAGTPNSTGEVLVAYPDDPTGLKFPGLNLIGNPFPTTAYLSDSRDFYRMNAAGDEIEAATGAINACEGIFVVAGSEETSVTFQTTDPVALGIGPNNSMINLSLSQNRGSVIDNARIRFGEGNNLPKFTLFDEGTMLYIPQGSKDYAVVYSNGQGEMPVNFKAVENGSYTLSFSTENVEMDYLHLIDNMTGADIDLLQTPSYTFNARTTDYASRFRLVFSANSVNDSETGSETFAFFNGSEWVVNASANATLQVVDMMGRIVLSTNGANTVSTNGMAQGVYVMRLVNGNDVKTQKIVVQ